MSAVMSEKPNTPIVPQHSAALGFVPGFIFAFVFNFLGQDSCNPLGEPQGGFAFGHPFLADVPRVSRADGRCQDTWAPTCLGLPF